MQLALGCLGPMHERLWKEGRKEVQARVNDPIPFIMEPPAMLCSLRTAFWKNYIRRGRMQTRN